MGFIKIGMEDASVISGDDVLIVLRTHGPLKAKHIGGVLRKQGFTTCRRIDVNRLLYSMKKTGHVQSH